MDCESLYLNNIEKSVSVGELENALVKFFPEHFSKAKKENRMQTTLWKRPQQNRPNLIECVAVVTGVNVNLEKLQKDSFDPSKKLKGHSFVFHEDFGEQRGSDGKLLYSFDPEDAKYYNYIRGRYWRSVKIHILSDNPTDQFKPGFRESRRIGLKNVNVPAEEIEALSISKIKSNRLVAIYKTSMDCFQAICCYNQTYSYGPNARNSVIIFQDERTGQECPMYHGKGIGEDGWSLDIAQTQAKYGYIPFHVLDSTLFDIEFYEGIDSTCNRCKSGYNVLGLDKDLRFAIGKCNCCYEKNVLEEGGAVHIGDEKFTRLIYHLDSEKNNQAVWSAYLPPIKTKYRNVEEFASTVLPQLEWEIRETWKHYVGYKLTVPELEYVDFVEEQFNPSEGLYETTFTVTVKKRLSHVWCQTLSLKLEKHVVFLFLMNEYENAENEAAEKTCLNVRDMLILDDEALKYCFITLTVVIPSGKTIVHNKGAILYFSTNTHVLQTAKQQLELWGNVVNERKEKDSVLQTFLVPSTATKLSNSINIFSRNTMQLLLKNLNAAQKTAVENAMNYSSSVVLGPPGTGKTLISASILALSALSNVRSLGIFPSFSSLEALDSAINGLFQYKKTCKNDVKILLVLSTHEEAALIGKQIVKIHGVVRYLHDEVQALVKQSGDTRLVAINNEMFIRGRSITEVDYDYWVYYTQEFESQIFKKYPVQLWSIEAVSDPRFAQYNKTTTENLDLMVIEEACSIPHFKMMYPLNASNPTRIIRIGDLKQLRGTLLSLECNLAGLALSELEIFYLRGETIPTVNLTRQYRLRGNLGAILNKLSYPSLEIENVPSISIPTSLQNIFGLSSHQSVLVIDHNGPETFIPGLGRSNQKEVEIIEKIINRLSKNIINFRNDLRIVTFYESQRSVLNRSKLLKKVSISLVDEVQGIEDDIVIASFVRSGHKSVGVAKQKNRLNVVLSRAKKLLILVMNVQTFQSSNVKFLGKMLETFKSEGAKFINFEEI